MIEVGWAVVAWVARECTLFAAVGFVLGGLDDLVIDLLWLARHLWRGLTVYRRHPRTYARQLPPPADPGRLALFVAAWQEGEVIGAMLRLALARLEHDDYLIFVGTYPNDPATRRAVAAVGDARIRLVPGHLPGPTTKAECLNRCWRALLADEQASGRRFKAVLIHDAEDMVHPLELRVIDRLIERFDLVQLPVLPLVDGRSRLVSGHYADEFAELHGRQVPLREALGAGIPAAGVGCALGRTVLARIAGEAGAPFDATSLTEDYEIGLRIGAMGARAAFVAMRTAPGGELVAVRAYFPATLDAAVRQKTRWITGIACAGWDRLRWQGGLAERWMRLRDRRAVVAALVLAAGYVGLAAAIACWLGGQPIAWAPGTATLTMASTAFFAWRVAMRAATVGRYHGWREAGWSVPRLLMANLILILAARRAILAYRPGVTPPWDKTSHRFPSTLHP